MAKHTNAINIRLPMEITSARCSLYTVTHNKLPNTFPLGRTKNIRYMFTPLYVYGSLVSNVRNIKFHKCVIDLQRYIVLHTHECQAEKICQPYSTCRRIRPAGIGQYHVEADDVEIWESLHPRSSNCVLCAPLATLRPDPQAYAYNCDDFF